MNTTDLYYELPEKLIAQKGLDQRAGSRLMVLHRNTQQIEDRFFADITQLIQPGDCLVINDTKVIPARFFVRRVTGGKIEGLFVKITPEGFWQVMLKNASRLRPEEEIEFIPHDEDAAASESDHIKITVMENQGQGHWLLKLNSRENHIDVLNRYGKTPLPPYISRKNKDDMEKIDHDRYQTVYADKAGSIAAPTAGLHFTPELLALLEKNGVNIARVTLHVGLGTFKPITSQTIEEHHMHCEYYELDMANADRINQTIEGHKRVIAVGTTSVRTLETLARNGRVLPGTGWTDIFITPGYSFQIVNALLTNFHLPCSTLLALVCALAGWEFILGAYQQAVEKEYRFYSYGDAMLIM
jgi:S-adenosylmethionine:tRNA ribosyltransferase-isomerase